MAPTAAARARQSQRVSRQPPGKPRENSGRAAPPIATRAMALATASGAAPCGAWPGSGGGAQCAGRGPSRAGPCPRPCSPRPAGSPGPAARPFPLAPGAAGGGAPPRGVRAAPSPAPPLPGGAQPSPGLCAGSGARGTARDCGGGSLTLLPSPGHWGPVPASLWVRSTSGSRLSGGGQGQGWPVRLEAQHDAIRWQSIQAPFLCFSHPPIYPLAARHLERHKHQPQVSVEQDDPDMTCLVSPELPYVEVIVRTDNKTGDATAHRHLSDVKFT
ncbi:translation initiation factor IF-2-like [Mauremys reevesii]|uniref:translation initiation factor IF-2-like n=1 Tax=Mauremys reevesii TaxID=260615 RepID=UPI00193F6EAC|nr:translation initiation factor IF-2-like [Mauremys reevesii]